MSNRGGETVGRISDYRLHTGGNILALLPDIHSIDAPSIRLNSVVERLCRGRINMSESATEFGLDLTREASFETKKGPKVKKVRYDLPESFELVSLYEEPNHSERADHRVTTCCLGIKPGKDDPPYTYVKNYWRYGNYPETTGSSGRVPKHICTDQFEESKKSNIVFAKFHLVEPMQPKPKPKELTDEPFVLVSPNQFTRTPKDESMQWFRQQMRRIEKEIHEGFLTKEERLHHMGVLRQLGWKMKLAKNPFAYEAGRQHANLCMAVVACAIARASGAKNIAVPSKELILRPGEPVSELARQVDSKAPEHTLFKRYRELKGFLSSSKQFKVLEWDGNFPEIDMTQYGFF